jgi:hypothetical protein
MDNYSEFDSKNTLIPNIFGIIFANNNKIYKNNLMSMKSLMTKFKKTAIVLMLAAVAAMGLQSKVMAQTTIVSANGMSTYVYYTYVSKIAGQIVTSQTGLTAKPGDEIEYEVVVAYYSSGSVPSNRSCTIPIPCYVNYHSVSADTGTIVYNNQKDTIRYVPPMFTLSASALPYIYGKITFTLVATENCYLLRANCGNRVIATQLLPWADYVSYGYPPAPGTFHYFED